MERGPMALFGALVAIGIGPALWLGAQFGHADVSPTRPPAVVSEQVDKAPGGAGAAPGDPSAEPTRHSRYVPLSGTPSARPSTSAPAGTGEPDDQVVTAKPSASAEPAETDDPTTPATDGTTQPADPTGPSTGEDPDETQPQTPEDPAAGQAAGEPQT